MIQPPIPPTPFTVERVECYLLDCFVCNAVFSAEAAELNISRETDMYGHPQAAALCTHCGKPLHARSVDGEGGHETETFYRLAAEGSDPALLSFDEWMILDRERQLIEGKDYTWVEST